MLGVDVIMCRTINKFIFYVLQRCYLSKTCLVFEGFFHVKFQDPMLKGAIVVPNSKDRIAAMLVLLMMGIYKERKWAFKCYVLSPESSHIFFTEKGSFLQEI
jgi:hypothetical protein